MDDNKLCEIRTPKLNATLKKKNINKNPTSYNKAETTSIETASFSCENVHSRSYQSPSFPFTEDFMLLDGETYNSTEPTAEAGTLPFVDFLLF